MSKYPKYYPAPPLPPLPKPCATARRLAMLRKLCAGATCATTVRMVQRVMRAWWGAENAVDADVRVIAGQCADRRTGTG
jgi:hypothetical protein